MRCRLPAAPVRLLYSYFLTFIFAPNLARNRSLKWKIGAVIIHADNKTNARQMATACPTASVLIRAHFSITGGAGTTGSVFIKKFNEISEHQATCLMALFVPNGFWIC